MEAGESLLHGLPGMVSFRMPLATVLAALASQHSLIPAQAQVFLLAALQSALLLCLCRLLYPAALLPFSAGTVLLAWAGLWPLANYPESSYAALVLLAAGVMVWRARAPSPAKTLLLTLALGATLLFRSSLAFFPPLLALFEYAGSRRPRSRGRLLDAALLCFAPYVLLIPWTRLNWVAYREIVPFERAAAHSNAVTGALGLVKTVEGPWENLMPPAPGPRGSVLRWAAGEAARHPVRYAAAVARRAGYVLSLHPVLCAAGLFALWRRRRERPFQPLGLLVVYYLVLHCLMTVLPRYFEPLWPLLAVAAAGLIPRFPIRDRAPAGPFSGGRWARAGLVAALALVLALCARTELLVAAYAAGPAAMTPDQARTGAPALLDRAVASFPDDAWLRFQRGGRRIERGDLAGAGEDLARGLALRPGDRRASLELAWVGALRGDARALLGWRDAGGDPEDARFRARVYQAHAELGRGRARAARERLLAAKKGHDAAIYVHDPATPREREVQSRLRASDSGFAWRAYALVKDRPEREKQAMLAALAPLVPETARLRVEQAYLAVRLRERREALARLDRARALSPGKDESLRIAGLLAELGRRSAGLAVLDELLRLFPEDAELWVWRAEALLALARPSAARGSLERARAFDPGPRELDHMAALSRRLEGRPDSLELIDSRLKSSPRDASLWLERAALSRRSADRDGVLRAVSRARSLTEDRDVLRRAALLYQGVEEHGLALGVLDGLVGRFPRDARLRADRGVSRYLRGSTSAAAADLEAAVALEPGLLSAYLSLGSIRSAQGRAADARALYDRALAVKPAADMEPMRARIRTARNELK